MLAALVALFMLCRVRKKGHALLRYDRSPSRTFLPQSPILSHVHSDVHSRRIVVATGGLCCGVFQKAGRVDGGVAETVALR